jgi:hypothetical protein
MTIKEIDKKLTRIKKQLSKIELEVIRAKNKIGKKKITTVDDWLKLGKEVSAKWDDISVSEEIKYQREKTW